MTMTDPIVGAAGAGLGMAPPTAAIVSIDELTTVFRRESGAVRVVDEVSLDLRRGEVLGIVGESGSGKSMLLRSMMRILPKGAATTGGMVTYDGRDLLSISSSAMHRIRGDC